MKKSESTKKENYHNLHFKSPKFSAKNKMLELLLITLEKLEPENKNSKKKKIESAKFISNDNYPKNNTIKKPSFKDIFPYKHQKERSISHKTTLKKIDALEVKIKLKRQKLNAALINEQKKELKVQLKKVKILKKNLEQKIFKSNEEDKKLIILKKEIELMSHSNRKILRDLPDEKIFNRVSNRVSQIEKIKVSSSDKLKKLLNYQEKLKKNKFKNEKILKNYFENISKELKIISCKQFEIKNKTKVIKKIRSVSYDEQKKTNKAEKENPVKDLFENFSRKEYEKLRKVIKSVDLKTKNFNETNIIIENELSPKRMKPSRTKPFFKILKGRKSKKLNKKRNSKNLKAISNNYIVPKESIPKKLTQNTKINKNLNFNEAQRRYQIDPHKKIEKNSSKSYSSPNFPEKYLSVPKDNSFKKFRKKINRNYSDDFRKDKKINIISNSQNDLRKNNSYYIKTGCSTFTKMAEKARVSDKSFQTLHSSIFSPCNLLKSPFLNRATFSQFSEELPPLEESAYENETQSSSEIEKKLSEENNKNRSAETNKNDNKKYLIENDYIKKNKISKIRNSIKKNKHPKTFIYNQPLIQDDKRKGKIQSSHNYSIENESPKHHKKKTTSKINQQKKKINNEEKHKIFKSQLNSQESDNNSISHTSIEDKISSNQSSYSSIRSHLDSKSSNKKFENKNQEKLSTPNSKNYKSSPSAPTGSPNIQPTTPSQEGTEFHSVYSSMDQNLLKERLDTLKKLHSMKNDQLKEKSYLTKMELREKTKGKVSLRETILFIQDEKEKVLFTPEKETIEESKQRISCSINTKNKNLNLRCSENYTKKDPFQLEINDSLKMGTNIEEKIENRLIILKSKHSPKKNSSFYRNASNSKFKKSKLKRKLSYIPIDFSQKNLDLQQNLKERSYSRNNKNLNTIIIGSESKLPNTKVKVF